MTRERSRMRPRGSPSPHGISWACSSWSRVPATRFLTGFAPWWKPAEMTSGG